MCASVSSVFTISAGKSTLIGQLASEGFKTARETARLAIENELAKGRTIREVHADWRPHSAL